MCCGFSELLRCFIFPLSSAELAAKSPASIPEKSPEVQYDMLVWAYLLDAAFYACGLPIVRRESVVGSTRSFRGVERKADGIVRDATDGYELLLIEAALPTDEPHQLSDQIKIGHMLKYASMAQAMFYTNVSLPLSVWGIQTIGNARLYLQSVHRNLLTR